MDATRVSIERHGDIAIAALSGSLLLDSAPGVRERLSRMVDSHPSVLVADLREVEEIDSSGLAVLLWMHRSQVNRGCRFIVVADNSMLIRAFEVTKLCDVFELRRDMPVVSI